MINLLANVPIPPLPPGGYEGTEGAYIHDLVNEISATTYVEAIVAKQRSGIASIGTTNAPGGTACGPCGQYTNFEIRRELYDQATVSTVQDLVYKLGLDQTSYTYYRRDFVSQALIPLTLTSKVSNRWSVLIVSLAVTPAALRFLLHHFASHREILPARVPT
jgi:hypothetical protein